MDRQTDRHPSILFLEKKEVRTGDRTSLFPFFFYSAPKVLFSTSREKNQRTKRTRSEKGTSGGEEPLPRDIDKGLFLFQGDQ